MVQRRGRRRRSNLVLFGWFDFKPFQGSGSAKEDLDEQWEAQQEILRARRNEGIDKEHLKQKYGKPKKKAEQEENIVQREVKIESKSPKDQTPAFKMPWEK